MIELSPLTKRHIVTLFHSEDVAASEILLTEQCADNLPLLGFAPSPASLERIRFAALRVSGGNIDRLRDAVRLAKTDWRDLLVAADFAHQVRAHEQWIPQQFDTALADRWLAGNHIPDVKFTPNQPVRILAGPRRGKTATVVALLGLEPEPRYRTALDPGENAEEFQRTLASTR